MYEEVVGVVGKNGVVEEDDVVKMFYLEVIVKEIFRRYFLGYFFFFYVVVKDMEFGGYDILVGVYVEFYIVWVIENLEIWLDLGKF